MNHIVLIGFMGSGKTKTGSRLARELDIPFLDLDKKITSEMKMSVTEVYSRFGEAFYRALETRAIKELIQEKRQLVITVGSGLPLQEQNHKYLKELGTVVYLKGSVATLKKRLEGEGVRSVSDKGSMEDKLRKILAAREPVYEKLADVTVDISVQPLKKLILEIRKKCEKCMVER